MAFEPTDFQDKVAPYAKYYYGIASKQFFTDFNPLTVDWTVPVPWGNEPDKCNMENDDSGCLMPNGAGLCVANSHRVLPPPTLNRPPRAPRSAIIFGFGVFFSVVTSVLTMVRRAHSNAARFCEQMPRH
jgi:hypothetical protein